MLRTYFAKQYTDKIRPFYWGRHLYCWAISMLFLIADIIWLSRSSYSVHPDGVWLVAKVMACILGVIALLLSIAKIPRYAQAAKRLRYIEVAYTLAWMLVLVFFTAAAVVLSYLSVAVNAPLIDTALFRFDQALGFDWLTAYQWVQSHPAFHWILAIAYHSGHWQLIGIPMLLGVLGRYEHVSELMLHVMLSSILMFLVTTPFPSSSLFIHFNISDPNTLSTVSDFLPLRDGTLREFHLREMQGLVSMPSFHTALAVFFIYAVRRIPWLLPTAILVNLAMIVSTPTQGAHYLADVFGGLALALATIAILKYALRVGTRHTIAKHPARLVHGTPVEAGADAIPLQSGAEARGA